MIWFLRVLFLCIFAAMVWVTSWASLQNPVWALPPAVTGDRWFIATLFDAYFGFITFFVWLAYKEGNALRSTIWLILILLLGNLAMSAYMLIQLFRVRSHAPLREVFLRREGSL